MLWKRYSSKTSLLESQCVAASCYLNQTTRAQLEFIIVQAAQDEKNDPITAWEGYMYIWFAIGLLFLEVGMNTSAEEVQGPRIS